MGRTLGKVLREVRIDDLRLATVPAVAADLPLRDVYALLIERRGGAVVVADEGRVLGIFTERDVLYRTAREMPDPETPIGEIMTRDPVTLPRHERMSKALEVMTGGGYRHLPLVNDEGLEVGVLTSREILRFVASHFPEEVLNLPPRLHQSYQTAEGG